MGMFKKKKENSKKKDKSIKKENKKKEEEIQNINTNKVKIIIWRHVGEDLAVQVGPPIFANEIKDGNNNLLAIDEKGMFKEDLNFSIDRIYEIMNFSLKMQNKKNSEKAVLLGREIKIQEEFLMKFEKDSSLNGKHNYRDEELKLKQLKIFRDSLRREKRGNYMRLGERGIRQFEFVSIDGILYPYFFGGKKFRVYPDLLVKKKIFNHEDTIFKSENSKLFQTSLNWILVVLFIVGILLTIANLTAGYYLYQKNSDVDMQINQGSITCLNALGTFTKNYGGALENYMKDQAKKNKENAKTESVISPKIPIINIDPNNINQGK